MRYFLTRGSHEARFIEGGKDPLESLARNPSERSAASGDQVEDKHDERKHKQ